MRQRHERATAPARSGIRLIGLAVGCVAVLVPVALTNAADAAPVATQTAVTLSATTAHPFQPVTATATVTPSTVAGSVTFTRSAKVLCTAVATSSGVATCTFTPTATSAAAAVTAVYTPTNATLTATSTGTGPALAVVAYPVTLKAVYDDNGSATCGQRAVTITVTRATVTGASPTSALPAPTGTVSVDGAGGITLPAGGSVAACSAVTTSAPVVRYSGDVDYATATATATKSVVAGGSGANHTRTGSGGVINVGSAPPSTGALASTASTHVKPLVVTAVGLLLAGLGCLAAGRRRTRSA